MLDLIFKNSGELEGRTVNQHFHKRDYQFVRFKPTAIMFQAWLSKQDHKGDSDTGADPKKRIYTCEVEDGPSEVGKKDGVEWNEAIVT